MKQSFQDNMAVMGYYVKNLFRYWKTTLKIMFNRSTWPDITVDELHERITSPQPPLVLDIRSPQEFAGADGHIPQARSISLIDLAKDEDLQAFKDREIVTVCPGGGLSLAAVDILAETGFNDVKSLHGGMDLWTQNGYPITTVEEIILPQEPLNPESLTGSADSLEGTPSLDAPSASVVHYTVDARNLSCPLPILQSTKAIRALDVGQVLEILTTDPGSKSDIPVWVQATGQELLAAEEHGPTEFRFLVKRLK